VTRHKLVSFADWRRREAHTELCPAPEENRHVTDCEPLHLPRRSHDDGLALLDLRHQCLLRTALEALVDFLVRFSPNLRQEILISVLVEH
jgi:hypothetical protein